MTNEEKFKNKVKDLLDEQQYSYDAANWETASKILDEEDAAKRRGFIYFLCSGLVIGLLITGWLLIPGSADQKKAEVVVKKKKTNSEIPKISGNAENKNKKSYPPQTTMVAPVEISERKQQHAEAKHNTATAEIVEQTVSPAATKPVKQPEVTQTFSQASPTIADLPAKKSAKKMNMKENRSEEDEAILQQSTSISLPIASNNTNEETLGSQIKLGQPAASTLPAVTLNEQTVNEAPNKTITDPPTKVEVNTPVASLPVQAKDSVIQPKTVSPLQDSLVKAIPQPTPQALPQNAYCYVEAGAYFNLGWNYKNAREGMGLNICLGMSYLAKLSDKMAFSIGGYYTTLSGLKQGVKEIRSSKVVFGEQTDVIAITPSSLNYILIPVKLQYDLTKKQAITIGYTAGYLLDVQSRVETYTERLNAQVDKTNYTTGGYVEGFKTFTSQLSLGYRRQLYSNLWLNGEIMYGLTDLRNNTFFGIALRENITGLKISLTYDLLKK